MANFENLESAKKELHRNLLALDSLSPRNKEILSKTEPQQIFLEVVSTPLSRVKVSSLKAHNILLEMLAGNELLRVKVQEPDAPEVIFKTSVEGRDSFKSSMKPSATKTAVKAAKEQSGKATWVKVDSAPKTGFRKRFLDFLERHS